MNLASITVSAALLGFLAPPIAQMSIQPIVAAKRANNFSIAESAAVLYAATAEKTSELPTVSDICDLDESESSVDKYTITCTSGSKPFTQVVSRSFRLGHNGFGLEITTDDDLDGFDDTTGMLTHYAECYSGWKGVEGQTLKNNCELGGPYVIPAYRHLYQ